MRANNVWTLGNATPSKDTLTDALILFLFDTISVAKQRLFLKVVEKEVQGRADATW